MSDESRKFGATAHVSKKKPKGHDAVLGALQESGRTTTIVTIAGEQFTGKVFGRDDYTITLLIGSSRIVFYKHAIERFYGEEAKRNESN